jgi:P4 family phage/plasmid primase-like protien
MTTGREKPEGPEIYFENIQGRRKFRPNFLAQDIEKEYQFKFVEDTEKFYVYKDGYWQDNAKRIIEEECNSKLQDEYEPAYKSKVVDTIKTRSDIRTTKEKFQPARDRIPFKNGTYDLNQEKLKDHKPEDNFTHKIKWDYDPDAQCPEINNFLDEILSNSSDKELILETIGYSLLSDYPYAHSLLLHGKGKNGKTVLMKIWKKLLSQENYKEEELQQLENGRFATRWVHRKLGLFCDDLPSTKLETGSTLKSLTGGGETRAEIKGGDHFEFNSYATPVFACNQIPESNDSSEGFYRRWEIVSFPYKFVDNPVKENQKQKKDKQKLMKSLTKEEEIKGLINEAIVRLEIMRENGGFQYKTEASSTRTLWKSYSTPFDQFVENCIEQGMTQKDAQELDEDKMDTSLNEYKYDFIVKDDLVFLINKYCEYYGSRAPSKTKITQKLKNESPYYVQEGRTRQLGNNNSRERVYKFVRFTDEFLDFVYEKEKCPDCPYFFENLRAHAYKIERSLEKSQDTGDTSQDVGSAIKDFIENKTADAVDEQEIYDSLDFSENKLDKKISNLKKEGELFRPQPGMVQKI